MLMMFRKSLTLKSLLVLYVVMDNFLMPIIIPYSVFSIQIQDRVLHWEAPQEGLLKPINFFVLLNATNVFGVLMSLMYDAYKRKASKILYGIEGPAIWKAL